MPDHIHGILIINHVQTPNLGVCTNPAIDYHHETPNLGVCTNPAIDNHHETPNLGVCTNPAIDNHHETPRLGVSTSDTDAHGGKGNIFWKPDSIGSIINQYKRICTINIRKFIIDFSWHPRYYDHIVRSQTELKRIRKYILLNPERV